MNEFEHVKRRKNDLSSCTGYSNRLNETDTAESDGPQFFRFCFGFCADTSRRRRRRRTTSKWTNVLLNYLWNNSNCMFRSNLMMHTCERVPHSTSKAANLFYVLTNQRRKGSGTINSVILSNDDKTPPLYSFHCILIYHMSHVDNFIIRSFIRFFSIIIYSLRNCNRFAYLDCRFVEYE